MIFDDKRRILGVHKVGLQWFVYRLSEEEYQAFSATYVPEDSYVALWRIFHRKIAIVERENPGLQRNNLPLRFRPYMTEFRESGTLSHGV